MTPRCLALFYGGPDQIIPLQTGLAALLAVALMFWNKLLVAFHRLVARSLDLFARLTPEQGLRSPASAIADMTREQVAGR